MALDPKFAEAFVNVEHKVLGFKLKPFSLWHKFLLESYGSPLTVEQEELPTATDVLQAIQVCRTEFPNTPERETFFDKVRILVRSWDQNAESEKFTNYLNDFLAFPEFWEKESDEIQKGSSAPESLTMVITLMEVGFTEKESWDMPLGKAYWYSSAAAILKGADMEMVTVEEHEMQENKDQILADMKIAEEKMKKRVAEGAGYGI